MLHLRVFQIAQLSAIEDLAIVESEHVSVQHVLSSLVCLNESLISVSVCLAIKLSERQEILPIDPMQIGSSNGESPHIEPILGGLDAASQLRIIHINWIKLNSSVGVSPETTERALSISPRAPKTYQVKCKSIKSRFFVQVSFTEWCIEYLHSVE